MLSYKQSSLMKLTDLIVYVDDIIVLGDDQEEIYRLKSLLSPRSSKSKILAVFGNS